MTIVQQPVAQFLLLDIFLGWFRNITLCYAMHFPF